MVRTHDQLSYIGPERQYTGPALNIPVPVNMFMPPMPQPFNGQPMPMGTQKKFTCICVIDLSAEVPLKGL